MPAIRHILVPVDFSDGARTALAYAAALAQPLLARLTGLHVAAPLPAPEEWGLATLPRLDQDRRRVLEHKLREFVTPPGADVALTGVAIREGDVPDEIVEFARQEHVDLIVLGTHGRPAFTRWILGSVAEAVVRRAHCPVLAVPPRPETPAFTRVLCAVDLSSSSTETLEHSAALARALGAPLTVMHVVDGPHGFEPWVLTGMTEADARRAAVDHARRRLTAMVQPLVREGLAVDTRVEAGPPAREVERALREGVDLAVLGVHASGRIDRLFFGSTARHVLRAGPCPVLLVHHAREAAPPAAAEEEKDVHGVPV